MEITLEVSDYLVVSTDAVETKVFRIAICEKFADTAQPAYMVVKQEDL